MGRLWAGDHEGAMVGAQRVLAALTSIMVGISVGVLTSQPAIAQPTTSIDPGSGEGLDPFRADMSSETLAIMRKQEALHPAVEILQRAIRESSSGYAGLALEGEGITLYWKGDLPSDVTRAMRSAQKIGPIKVRSARFSRAELELQAERISSVGRTDIQSIFVPGDGSGLSIEKMPPDEAGWAALKSPVTTAEQAVASVPSNIPVKIATAHTSVELTACAGGVCSRLDDESAWNSGTFIARNGTYLCSTGFGVNVLSQPGLHHILTAAHCGSAGDYFIDFTGELVGSMGLDDWDRDVGTIQANGWYWMWDGPSTTTFHKTVHSWWYPADGELVCQSGYHGTVCNMQTQSGATYAVTGCDSDGDCYTMHAFKKVVKLDAGDVAVRGDSGGPVFTLDGDGVRAKGLVTARTKSSASAPYYDIMYYQDMVDIRDRNGLEPRTG
jgi:streptogrisin D